MRFLLLALVAANCFVLFWCHSMPPPAESIPVDESVKKCMAQENVEHQYVIDFANGKIKPEIASANFKCFVHCIVEARGYLKDGRILEENIFKTAENITSVEQVRKIISSCKIVKGTNACETSFDIYICISSDLK